MVQCTITTKGLILDANYRFILVDIGEAGKESDSGVFSNSVFGQSLESNALPLPQPKGLPDRSDIVLPYVFVGDEGFPLRNNLLRPYPGRNLSENKAIFNYRSSRARRIIENSFGILAARFRIFHHPINATPDRVVAFIKATIVLHNFLRVRESVYCPPGFVDGEDGEGNVILGEWRTQTGNASAMQRIGRMGSNRRNWTATSIRDDYSRYFCSPKGEVPWKYHHVHRTSY